MCVVLWEHWEGHLPLGLWGGGEVREGHWGESRGEEEPLITLWGAGEVYLTWLEFRGHGEQWRRSRGQVRPRGEELVCAASFTVCLLPLGPTHTWNALAPKPLSLLTLNQFWCFRISFPLIGNYRAALVGLLLPIGYKPPSRAQVSLPRAENKYVFPRLYMKMDFLIIATKINHCFK